MTEIPNSTGANKLHDTPWMNNTASSNGYFVLSYSRMRDMNQQHVPLLVIVGSTAVGKTALAIALARSLGGEIVSADSRQVYRGMDIGTAKPSAAERAAAPHHLIDVVDPDTEFSLARYQDLATAAIAAIVARGRLPLLVGGTGQYLAALLEGW